MTKFENPYNLPPHPLARAAAAQTLRTLHEYMQAHPESELHRQGKMCGVLVVRTEDGQITHLQAFSAMLDGQKTLPGFVPPIYDGELPVGYSKEQSRRLQQLFFAEQYVVNTVGEKRSLLDIFRDENPILSPEEWFDGKEHRQHVAAYRNPPSGAGECCGPKLLQYALTHGLQPLALAEFWVGASPKNELRREGCFYAPCSGRCKPILRWMMGIETTVNSQLSTVNSQLSTVNYHIDILYEDEWLMVVNKSAGLLSVPGKNDEPYVAACLQRQVQAVHRLDQDTSGLLVLAKTPDVYKELQAYFQRRDILKRYEAILRSNIESPISNLPSEGLIDLPLLPNPYDRPRQMVDRAHGKPAITRYVVRERRSDHTLLVDFFPLTGRTHQLRVHAAHPEGLNAPIVGDRLYGDAASARRLMLHAAEIAFVHPITKKEMHFCIPSDF